MSVSKLMLHMKICNVRTYVTYEYEMCSVQTIVTYENVQCSNIYYIQYDRCSVRTYATYEFVMYPNLLHTRKYDVSGYIRKYLTSDYTEI